MQRKFNYNLETGSVGTDDEYIANILYNINRMEMKANYKTTNIEELKKALGELFFICTDSKVNIFDFIEANSDTTDNDLTESIVATMDEAMKKSKAATREACTPNADPEKICEVFVDVYKMMLGIVPTILLVDDQSKGSVSV